MATYGPQSLNGDNLGMALMFRRGDRREQTGDGHSHVSVMKTPAGKLEYYFLAAWEKDPDGIENREQFVSYLEPKVEKLTHPPRILVAGLGYGRGGGYHYYMSEPVVSSDPKGVGPFPMASVEISARLEPELATHQ